MSIRWQAARAAQTRIDLSRRSVLPEWMDRPDLDPHLHRQALAGLARLNRLSRSAAILWRPIARYIRQQGRSSLSLLDLASGAGDVTIELWRRARRAGIALQAVGCDKSPLAVEQAAASARAAGADVEFRCCDVLADALPEECDIVVCSLFLHHQEDLQAVQLLRRMAAASRGLVLVNDLLRSRRGYLLARIATRLLSRSPVVHFDGPQSVAAALSLSEVRDLAERAGLPGASVERRWPCRFLLNWSKPR